MCMNRPCRILEVDVDSAAACVDVDGRHQRVSLAVLTFEGVQVAVGDWVLLNAGVPVERIEPGEAERVMSMLSDIEGEMR
jgi:hydrogenase assembly chaperone HypC/HupF